MSVAWKESTFLVTGGAGLIGSHITDQLVNRRAKKVIILDNFTRGTHENLRHAVKEGNVKIVEGDLRDTALVDDLVGQADYVFHQAALRITQCQSEPLLCQDVLIGGTANVIEAAVKHRIKKLVAASSASVYGMAQEFPTKEDHHPYDNRTIYGAAKLANEAVYRSYNEIYGLPYIALRYFNVYGPRMDTHGLYTEVIIRWLNCIDKNEVPVIHGDGRQTMDFVYVTDIAECNLLALEGHNSDEVFNVGTGIETKLIEVWDTLKELTGTRLEPVFKKERKVNSVRRRLASTGKAKVILGFEAKTSLRQGMVKLIAWWNTEGRTSMTSRHIRPRLEL